MKFNFQLKFDSLFEFSAPSYDDRQISYLLTEAQFRVFIKRYNPLGNKYQKGFEADEQRRRDLEQLIKPATISAAGITGAITYNGTWTTGSNVVTIVAGGTLETTIGLNDGQAVSAIGIGPAGDANSNTIKNVIDDTHFTLESTPSAAGTAAAITAGLGKSAAQGGVHPEGVFLDMPSDFLYAVEEAAKLSTNTKESWIKPVRHDEYLANINNPYKQPYKDLVWRMDISRYQHAEGDSVNATSKRSELILPNGYTLDHYRVRYLSTPPAIVVDEFDESNQRHCILDETLHREIVDEAVVIAQAAVQKDAYQVGLSEKQRSE